MGYCNGFRKLIIFFIVILGSFYDVNGMMCEVEIRKEHGVQMTFSDLKPDSRVMDKQIAELASAAVVDMIRKMAGWSPEDSWNVPGVFFADEMALIYDVSTAFKPSPKGGWAAKRMKEEAARQALNNAGQTSTEPQDE